MERPGSEASSFTSSSTSMSTGLFTPTGDKFPLKSYQSSDEESSDSSGGVSISKRSAHSRTPSISFTPPPADGPRTFEPPQSGSCSRDATPRQAVASTDTGLDMPEVGTALDDVARRSAGSGPLLQPDASGVSINSSPRPASRRRSSSRVTSSPYNVLDEELPPNLFYRAPFQKAFKDAKQFMSELATVLSSNSIHLEPDSTMRQLHQRAGDLASFHCPSTRTVGLVGDSGVGKSSLLNSLLDFKDLARTSNSGAACTCVTTEYHYHNRDDFAVEVEWFTRDEIMTQLTSLLHTYRDYHLHGAEFEKQDREELEKGAQVAQDLFRVMFKGRLGDESFLTQSPEDTAIDTLRSWVGELYPSSSGRQEELSLENCTSILTQLSSEADRNLQPAKWPYLRKIKVFLNAYILSKGLVLVDLPGLRDLNSARRNVTERYLRSCHEIFAICPVGRAMSDPGVLGVFDLAKQAELTNIKIVCTRSDEIQEKEELRTWSGERVTRIQHLMNSVNNDEQSLQSIEDDLEELRELGDLFPEETNEVVALSIRSTEVEKQRQQHAFELKQFLMNTRNGDIVQDLEVKYRSKVPDNDLKVFCVSNHIYQEHRDKSKEKATRFLQLSGIVALRKHCISIVADSQRRLATKYIRHDIPAMLSDIDLWVQSGAGSVNAEQKDAIREALNAMEAQLTKKLIGRSSRVSTTARSLNTAFKTQIYDRSRIADWTEFAGKVSKQWYEIYHHSTYIAFCQKSGLHKPPPPYERRCNWNEEVLERTVNDLNASWRELRITIQSMLENNQRVIDEQIDWAIGYLDTKIQVSLDPLIEAMTIRQNLLREEVEDANEKFEKAFYALKKDAVSSAPTSFFGKLMADTYEESRRVKVTRRKKEIIEARLGNEEIFRSLLQSFRDEFGVLAETFQNDIQNAIARNLSSVTRTLDIVRSQNVALESERDMKFRDRVESENARIEGEIKRIKAAIAI